MTKIESKVMKFPDKIIVFLGQMKLRGNKKENITPSTCLKQLTTTVIISWREKCNLRDT